MSVIIKGDSAFDMSLVSNIKDVQSPYIKFQNIYFKCKSIEDAGGTIFVKRKRGKWLPDNNNYLQERFICSVCGRSYKVDTCMGKPMWDFCPCGAEMRGEQDG